MSSIETMLAREGYIVRPQEAIALKALAVATGGMKAILLEGPPGCGKTHLAEAYARATHAAYVYTLLHSWSDDQELHVGVNVAAAVAGDAANVRQPGVLAEAARLSLTGPVVLCLDEIDKTQERAENLLLDFLQTGRVPVAPGVQVQAKIENVVVFITSNAQRELGEATLRRVRRVRMRSLPVETLNELAAAKSGAPAHIVSMISKAAREIAEKEETTLSLQELTFLCSDIVAVAENLDDVRNLFSQWAAKREAGAQYAQTSKLVSAVWAELKRTR
jgi:MoxR-like ATPase